MFKFLATVILAIGVALEHIVPVAGTRSLERLWKPKFFSSREAQDDLDDKYPGVPDDNPRNGSEHG